MLIYIGIALLVINLLLSLIIFVTRKNINNTTSINTNNIESAIHDIAVSLSNSQKITTQQIISAQSEIIKAQNASSDQFKNEMHTFSEKTVEKLNQMDKEILGELKDNLTSLYKANDKRLVQSIRIQHADSEKMQTSLAKFSESSIKRLNEMESSVTQTLNKNLDTIRTANEQKLTELQSSVNEKLDKSLNDRLDTSFSKITEHLEDLYKSLGELNKMSSDISNLNRSLTNVKIRGTWGEAQLRDIIQETMVSSQYEENVITKPNSNDPVEFAIKIPSKDNNNDYILLPIDSKFPLDRYNDVINASETGDKQQLQTAIKQLEVRVKEEARKIRDKYISVPKTTNFAVMYLPTESLYAEVLRINGLSEFCQTQYSIIIAGPTTITALLNSLRVGFQNLTLSKKTSEVQKLLVAIKDQFDKMDDLIEKAQKKIAAASDANEQLAKRSGLIQKRLAKIGADMPTEERALLQDPGVEESIATEAEETINIE